MQHRFAKFAMISALGGLAACGEVVNETTSTLVVDGNAYELRTRTIQGQNGTFDQSSVKVQNRIYTCLPNSPGDCEATVRLARSESRRSE